MDKSSSFPLPLARLAELAQAGLYIQALDLLRQSPDLLERVQPAHAEALAALLLACDTCEEEARTHHDALGRAIAREQTLGARLRECTDSLVHTQSHPQ